MDVMNKKCNVRTVCLGLKTGLNESAVAPWMVFGIESWGMWKHERNEGDFKEIRRLNSMRGVTRFDRITNEMARS